MSLFGNQYFYHGIMRKYVTMFGNLFNDITVQRTDDNGVVTQILPVPIAYAPKQSYIARLAADPNTDRGISIQLPRLAFEITGLNRAHERSIVPTQKNYRTKVSDANILASQFVPTPYDINFSLYAFPKNSDDGLQILEQILPFFVPEWTSTLLLIPELDLRRDIPTILQNVTLEDTYEQGFLERRAIIWTLDFLVKGYLFGPVDTGRGLIKRVQIDFHSGNGASDWTDAEIAASRTAERIVITPGQFANGSPTTNSTLSVAYQTILANSDYGFAQNTFSFLTDGRNYNPITGLDE